MITILTATTVFVVIAVLAIMDLVIAVLAIMDLIKQLKNGKKHEEKV